MAVVAGLDLGTSSAKLTVVTTDGEVLARAEHAYPTHTGAGGVAEQSPEQWWAATRAVLAASGCADRIDAVGLTGHMQDLIPVRGSAPVRPALLYSDTRATRQHARLLGAIPQWERRTGNHQDASSVVAKIAWLAEHEPETLDAAEHLLLGPAGYVALRGGGEAACDVTTASTTGLLDVTTRGWLEEAVVAAGGRPGRLPRLVGQRPGDALVGEFDAAAAAELGLRPGTPIVHAMGDAGATTDGLVGTEPGDAYLYLGTSGWLAATVPGGGGEPSPIHSLVLPGWATRLRIGAVQSAGAASAWAKTRFFPDVGFPEVEERVADRVGLLDARPLCLPGLTGERTPVRDAQLRGAFVGVTDATDAVDLYLAVLTGAAMGLRHSADDMGVRQDRIALVGGAAGSASWRQILADVFGATIVTGEAVEPAAHSAARTAAETLGLDHSLHPLLGAGRAVIETAPSGVHERYRALLPIHRGIYDALTPVFHKLAGVAQN